MFNRYAFLSLLLSAALLGTLVGCQSQAATAQKLLAERKYEEVIRKFPDTQFSRRAEAMMAEDLLEQGKHEEILQKYPQSRAAYLAIQAKAKQLFDNKEYRLLIEQFPTSPLAVDAERILADELYNQGLFDSLIHAYPNSDRGKEVKEARAEALFGEAKKLSGQKRIEKLEEITRFYNQTRIYKDAATMLSEARGKTQSKPATLKPTPKKQ